jgi:hypothetical protein
LEHSNDGIKSGIISDEQVQPLCKRWGCRFGVRRKCAVYIVEQTALESMEKRLRGRGGEINDDLREVGARGEEMREGVGEPPDREVDKGEIELQALQHKKGWKWEWMNGWWGDTWICGTHQQAIGNIHESDEDPPSVTTRRRSSVGAAEEIKP